MIFLNSKENKCFTTQMMVISSGIVLAFMLYGCQKEALNNEIGEPVFLLSYFVNGEESNGLSAGIDGYYLFTEGWVGDENLEYQSILTDDLTCSSSCGEALGMGFHFSVTEQQDFDNTFILPDGNEIVSPGFPSVSLVASQSSNVPMFISWPTYGVEASLSDSLNWFFNQRVPSEVSNITVMVGEFLTIDFNPTIIPDLFSSCQIAINFSIAENGRSTIELIGADSIVWINDISGAAEVNGTLDNGNISAIILTGQECVMTIHFNVTNVSLFEPFNLFLEVGSQVDIVEVDVPYGRVFYRAINGRFYHSVGLGTIEVSEVETYINNEQASPTVKYNFAFESRMQSIDNPQDQIDISGNGVFASRDFRMR